MDDVDLEETSYTPTTRRDGRWLDTSPGVILAPVSGRVVPLKQIPDPVFRQGMLGQGCGIWPQDCQDGSLRAPFRGVVSSVSRSNHGIAVTSDDGVQLLIHVGVDTVEMRGRGFERLRQKGERVEAGDELMRFDVEAIREAGYPEIVICVVVNSRDYASVEVVSQGETVRAGEPLLRVSR